MVSQFPASESARSGWATGLVVGIALVLGAALLPPYLPAPWRAALMAAFSAACHQLPARSLHVDGVQLAVCDRCLGIYSGLLGGSLALWALRRTWQRFETAGRYVLLGALVPLGIDWIGPVLGLWQNTPVSRALTGFLFGAVAGAFVVDRLLRSASSSAKRLSVQDRDA